MRRFLVVLFSSAVIISPAWTQQKPALKLPPGFTVTPFADSKLANDIYCLTIDPKGRVVVAGRGYIRILVDDNNDQKADRSIQFADSPKDGAMGLLWEEDSLYVTGDGGLRVFHDKNGDDRADGPSDRIRKMRTGGEHTAHAIRRGPDGWLYVLCGNHAGIDASFADTKTSPIQKPTAGCVLRFSPDLERCEIVSEGFRNPYGMDFDRHGELFVYDSDNERCVSLPWYEPTRFYHVIPGGHCGWLSPQQTDSWRRPPYFCDVIAPIATLGRGSPTGVACYRHSQFPEQYRGGMFLADWTFGRIYFVSLKRKGSTYETNKEVFLEATGDNGFAPTALAVQPQTGDLFVSIGGRGTRGGVYRIRFEKGQQGKPPASLTKRSLDWQANLKQSLLLGMKSQEAFERRRALELINRHHERFNKSELLKVVDKNCSHPDRYIRLLTAKLTRLSALNPLQPAKKLSMVGTTTITLGRCETDPTSAARLAVEQLRNTDKASTRLANLRLLQLSLGDIGGNRGTIWEGYTSSNAKLAARQLELFAKDINRRVLKFPTGDSNVDRETSRTIGMLAYMFGEHNRPFVTDKERRKLLDELARRWTPKSDPTEDIHYLTVFALIPGKRSRSLTDKTASTLLSLGPKIRKRGWTRDRNWPFRIRELYKKLAQRDSRLHDAMVSHRDFGRSDHALFARSAGFDRQKAARIFIRKAKLDDDFEWNAQLIDLVAGLPRSEALPVLRSLWDNAGLEAAILPHLTRQPSTDDRAKFIRGLSSTNLQTVQRCLAALNMLDAKQTPTELANLIRLLKTLPEKKSDLRNTIAKRLQRLTGIDHGVKAEKWLAWLAEKHPQVAKKLLNPDGVSVNAWRERLGKIDWSAGHPSSGRKVFIRSQCATCHSGSQALGPDLAGVGKRFSRDDLLTAILQPSRDVSARYQTKLVETAEGKLYQGRVVYHAVDSLILQTGPADLVRIPGQAVVTMKNGRISLMPAGLLDRLSDKQIADLYAYLRSLDPKK